MGQKQKFLNIELKIYGFDKRKKNEKKIDMNEKHIRRTDICDVKGDRRRKRIQKEKSGRRIQENGERKRR